MSVASVVAAVRGRMILTDMVQQYADECFAARALGEREDAAGKRASAEYKRRRAAVRHHADDLVALISDMAHEI